MFRKAWEIAKSYTVPVVISRRTIGGVCSSNIAAAIVVNNEGWILSAAHVLAAIPKLEGELQKTRAIEQQIQAIDQNQSLNRHERKSRLAGIKKPKPSDTDRWSAWFGPKTNVSIVIALEAADLALAKLDPFDEKWVGHYPEFQNPDKFANGASLCRMGFPFHQIEPTYDATTNSFNLPPGAVPLPLFPNEGILSRVVNVNYTDPAGNLIPQPVQIQMFETSSPGIPGQSGGPIFDVDGVVWGIQSSTHSYRLDLNLREPQYLHVGVGVHTSTILAMLKQHGVKYKVAQG